MGFGRMKYVSDVNLAPGLGDVLCFGWVPASTAVPCHLVWYTARNLKACCSGRGLMLRNRDNERREGPNFAGITIVYTKPSKCEYKEI